MSPVPARKPTLPPPHVLGLPAKFTSFRSTQVDAIVDITDSDKSDVIINAPTGTGKQLLGPAIAHITDSRVLVLTATKVLQDSNTENFAEIGMVDVRGANNYPCPALAKGGELQYLNYDQNPKPMADKGPCLSGVKCSLRGGGCPRYDTLRQASRAQIVVSNYDCWLAQGKVLQRSGDPDADETMGTFDYLFMDEMHQAAAKVSDAIRVTFDPATFARLLDGSTPPSASDSIPKWTVWAREVSLQIAGLWDELKLELKMSNGTGAGVLMKEIRELQDLYRTVDQLSRMTPGWVVDTVGQSKILTFEPIWPSAFCPSLLYRGIERRVGMSATIRPAALKYVGIREEEADFFEYDSPFPVNRRIVWQWPAVQLNYKKEKEPETQRKWASAIDELRAARQDRKGLVFTQSYRRMTLYEQLTQVKEGLVTHEPRGDRNLHNQLKRFRDMPPPATFASPVIDTGHDFPGKQAEYGIIGKTPYPPMDSVVMRARLKDDPTYGDVCAAEKFTQECGRGSRSIEDGFEAICVDSTVGALFNKFLYFSKWFRRAWRFTKTAPKPPPKLW